jgi:hypothetical protein
MNVREIRIKSAAPVYGAAAAWALLCIVLPVHSPWRLLIPVAGAVAAYIALGRVFPGSVRYVEEPETLAETGDEAVDSLLREGEAAVAEMLRLRGAASDFQFKDKVARIAELTIKIFKDVIDDPSDFAQVRRFADVFLPEILKIIGAYSSLAASGSLGEGVESAKARAIGAFDTIIDSCQRQFDALFNNQILDLETDIKVLEAMLKREGLAGSDFGA